MNNRKRKERDFVKESPTRRSPRKQAKENPATTENIDEDNSEELHSKEPKLHKSVKSTREKDYTSDGISFESLDDTLPDINISSPYKGRKYAKDDIVWAPYKNMYWPAVVTSVKWPQVCFLFINEQSNHVFRTEARRLLSFDNPEKNLELKDKGEKAYIEFKAAYELVVKYLCKKKQNTNINARRYLTLSAEYDKVSQAKDCIFRLTGVCESNSLSSGQCEDDNGDVDETVIDLNDADICVNNIEEDIDCTQSAEERAKLEEIWRELETLPRKMTVSHKELEGIKDTAKLLLDIIQTQDCFDHLMKIRNGLIPSSRHMKYTNGELVHGGLGPFTLFNDLTSQLLTALDNHCDEYDGFEYKHHVMLPEAIIFAVMKLHGWSKPSAKTYFNSMCKKVGVRE